MKKRLLLGFSALILLGLGGGFAWLSASLPMIEGVQVVDGLRQSVEITRDSRGIPHIRAKFDEDAYFALGYVHAQDRFWQMEATRRHGAGRLAEVIGQRALPSDKFMRTLGIGHLASLQFQRMDAATRRSLEAYAAGVNSWMNTRSGPLPPEFIALGYSPEPWRPADSLLWSKSMAIKLSGNLGKELLRARLAGKLSPERISELWPPYSADTNGAAKSNHGDLFDGLSLARLAAAIPDTARLAKGASNAWVVSGELTESGKPLLANDPHLGFAAPVLWYLVSIEAPGLRIDGATAPSVPFTIFGHNNSIAWGISSTMGDHEDLFVEKIDPNDSSRYLTPQGSLPFKTRKEVIAVKNSEDVTMTVRQTRHGPVISDILDKQDKIVKGGKLLALSATYLREDDLTPQTFYHLNRVTSWDEFIAAFKNFHSPHLNFVYAHKSGDIGFIAAGRAPIRRSGRGRFPQPGWTGEADWTGFIPFDQLPKSHNPSQNIIVNANNKIVADDYPYLITDDWGEPYRARRILDLLKSGGRLSLNSMAEWQNDNSSLAARELLPMMLKLSSKNDKTEKAMEMLNKWDWVMDRDRPEPAIFTTWLREFNRSLYADELGDLFEGYWSLRPEFISSVLGGNRLWCDNINTPKVKEDCQSILQESLERALDDLNERLGAYISRWRWGDLHQARFKHPLFAGVSLIGELASLSIATSGGDYTVNRGAMRISSKNNPFDNIHGPGFRAIYDLSDLSNSQFIIATGQSGNFLSDNYADMLDDWRDGNYLRLAGKVVNPQAVLRLIPRIK